MGLAGGIAAGKSLCATLLAGTRGATIDADKIVHELQKEPDVVSGMESALNARLRSPDGTLDRAAAAKITFSQPEKRASLEAFLHPLVRERIDASIAKYLKTQDSAGAPEIVLLDVPLLFEGGLYKQCDYVVFVEAPARAREQRAQDARGWDSGEIARREANQLNGDEKRRRSDFIIQNSGSIDALAADAAELRGKILDRWRARPAGTAPIESFN